MNLIQLRIYSCEGEFIKIITLLAESRGFAVRIGSVCGVLL